MTDRPSLLERPVGSTGLKLPRLGFGAAPIGNLYRPVSDEVARASVQRALDEGIRYFDTAPHYGFGLSEQRLGTALAGAEVLVSSKVGRSLEPVAPEQRGRTRFGFADARDFTPVFDYGYDAVHRQLEQTRERLGRLPDIVYAHDLGPASHGEADADTWRAFREGGYRALAEWRAAGRIRAIGLGVNEVDVCLRALDELEPDLFLLAGRYTLLEQPALAELLPRCEARGVGVVIGGAFNSGILATGVRGPGPFYYDYQPASQSVMERVGRLEAVCEQFDVPLPAAALQFPAAHPAVVSVIAGCASAEEVSRAREWMDRPLPAAFWRALRERELLPPRAPVPGEAP